MATAFFGCVSVFCATEARAEAETISLLETLLRNEAQSMAALTESDLEELANAPAVLTSLRPQVRPEGFAALEATLSSSRFEEHFIREQPRATGGESWRCLTEALYFEARGEDLKGLYAVGEVILNRVEDRRYPGTVCGVVYQGTGRLHGCQFSYACDGRPEHINDAGAWNRVGKVARILLDGAPRVLTDGATHYHARWVSPSWARQFPRTASIGVHHFYRWN